MIESLKKSLNPEQFQAVSTIEGPLLIIAGAGSGKTRVITHRIHFMLDQGVPQSSILALTFTNKAAKEMEERIHQLTQKKLRSLTVSTFHAFGVQILKKHSPLLGWRPGFSIYDSADQNSLVRECLRVLKRNPEDYDVNGILSSISRIKCRRSTFADFDDPQLKAVYDEYHQHLKLYNAFDFDDLIALSIQLLEDFPEVLAEYRERYRYFMVDEFQDTSLQQYSMLRLLGLDSRNVCVVGDDDQSIYSWRGANFENIRLFETDFPERVEIKLEQNYRSSGNILEAANQLIANNRNRKEKALWTPSGSGNAIELYHLASEAEEANFIADSIKTICMRDKLNYDDFGVLIRTNALSRQLEESFMAAKLPYKLSGGTSFFQRPEVKDMLAWLRVIANPDDDISLIRCFSAPRRGIGKSSIQVLVDLAGKLGSSLWGAIEELAEKGETASLSLYGEQGDLFATDKVSGTDEHDSLARFRSLGQVKDTSSVPKVPKNVTGLNASAFRSIIEVKELIENYRPKFFAGKKMAESLRLLVHELDYWAFLLQEFQKNEKIAQWRFHNIEVLCSSLEQFEKDPDTVKPDLFQYLNRVTLSGREEEDEEGTRGKVNLMTIHASKGLEFSVVFLAGVEDGIIPHKRALLENEEGDYESNLEEERRLFYVAITRARHKLFMTACRQRSIMRQTVETALSPFLQELPKHLLEWKEAKQEVLEQEEGTDAFMRLREKLSAREAAPSSAGDRT